MENLITIKDYAKLHDRDPSAVRKMCLRGRFKSARKLGRDWFINKNEPYPDARIKSGKYVGWRKTEKKETE